MAQDAGFSVLAIDCYADEDLQALEIIKVASLAVADLQPVVDSMIKTHGVEHVIYGSGFEIEVESLDYLQSRFVVLGNSASLFRRFQDKADFFKTLDQLCILHPETVFSAPALGLNWLVKPMQGEGGYAIERFSSFRDFEANRYYWQRYLEGEVFSVLFAAGQGRIKILGFNQQWACDEHEQAFLFAGVSNMASISSANKVLLLEWLSRLIRVYPLQGLGSLDFIVHKGQCYVLEINARIPASAQLYGLSVFDLHLQACLGEEIDFDIQCQPMGFQVIYARQAFKIPHDLIWPDEVVDRPAGGVFVGKGQPVCSIIVQGNDAVAVKLRLQRLQNIVENLLQTGSYHHAIPG